ncbi:MAG: flagellar protein FlaG [Spirochaetaceae bacterium]|jgi:flagellar protein FlaG|nr:flagellar protein FlaG [Spirochaetaceae bacterium]
MVASVVEMGFSMPQAATAKRKPNFEYGASLTNDSNWDNEVKRFASSLPGNDTLKNIRAGVERLQKISLAFNKKLQFVINHESNEITVNVIDPDTDKVIKVLPPEELQRLQSKIEEAIGFLFDEKV